LEGIWNPVCEGFCFTVKEAALILNLVNCMLHWTAGPL